MPNQKLVAVSTLQVFIIAFLFGYFRIEIRIPRPQLFGKLYSILPRKVFELSDDRSNDIDQNGDLDDFHGSEDAESIILEAANQDEVTNDNEALKVFSQKELSKYDGSIGAPGLYLALLGQVYDVEKGRKHYGPGGGYHFFAGKDASRAFVTGDFTEKGLVDSIEDLTSQDLLGIQEWIQFYEKEYKTVGTLSGTYYDNEGRPTSRLADARKLFESAKKWQQSQKADYERYPPCNSEWTQGKGGRVWCSSKSGGISRDWAGVPRKLFTPGTGQSRCACVKDSGSSQDSQEADGTANARGDLDNANLRLYDDCDPKAVSCNI